MLAEQLSYSQCVDRFVTGDEEGHFGKPLIDDGKYQIKPIGFRELNNEINGDLCKWSRVFGMIQGFEWNT